MSLDVSLIVETPITKTGTGIIISKDGKTRELSLEEVMKHYSDHTIVSSKPETHYVFTANITHNLVEMAKKAGLYYACWRPLEIQATQAREIIPYLKQGLENLKEEPEYFKRFNPENGWGSYDMFVPWVEKYLNACIKYPNAIIEVDR